MDKALILKILGKKDSVDLGDMIFNLRDICYNLRDIIDLDLDINNDFILDTKEKLNNIYTVVKAIENNLNSSDNLIGYTNSKNYLLNFITKLCSNLLGLINSFEPLEIKKLIYYNNVIIDVMLIY